MKVRKNIFYSLVAAVAAGALSLTGVGIASATSLPLGEVNTKNISTYSMNVNSASTTSDEYVEKFAQDLEILFTRYIPQVNGKYQVNEGAVVTDGYAEQMEDFYVVANAFNEANQSLKSGNAIDVSTRSAGSYAKCVVLGGLGIPATAFTYGTWTAITTAISAWNWGLAASTVVRALGPAFITGAGKALGGPALVASALAVAAVSCAF
ncbi:hypothetical protein [Gleimia hominis]|uniref:hypothetical protein n=1 Tax=Gleimia hominis TaxID=595468 RepID=UPI0011AF63B1|nr:hypothetical protein [Gleimia hominis]WIK64528.1 hypothetical protein CJ187_000205 [Gleimia hominis]